MGSRQESALSTYRILVSIVWVGLILLCAYLGIGTAAGMINPRLFRPILAGSPWGPGIALGVPWDSLTAAQWRAFGISVGLWSLVGGLLGLAAVDQVRRILSSASDKTPFTRVNVDRMRNAGLAVFGVAAAKAFRDLAFASFVGANVKVPGIEVMYVTDLGLATAFIGLMVLAVAEVVRHGVRLQDDQDLTV